jgi:hypothetical protein
MTTEAYFTTVNAFITWATGMPLETYFMPVNIFITPTGVLRRKISLYASRAVVLLYNRTFFITWATV